MIRNKVTIVLGAGASYPYGFPLGGELKDKIIDQFYFRDNLSLNKILSDIF
jgi:hypothetical protein